MVRMMTLVVLLAFVSTPASAQGITHSQEIELGTDGFGGSFFSEYILFDGSSANGFARPFWVNNTLTRLELGIGPTFKTGPVTHKLQFGGTTDRELMFAGLWLFQVAGRQVIAINDFKPALGETNTSLYNKVIWALDHKGVINGRYEQLYLKGLGVVFVRPGVEYQIQFQMHHVPAHIYIAPFYDPKIQKFGGQIGFRFFDLKLH